MIAKKQPSYYSRAGSRSKQNRHSQRRKEENLKIIPLGGMEEVGRNMTIFEYGEDIVILDMGLQFPEEDMPGIDYIIPNISYLKGKEKNIRAVIFSHGHLDHIGAGHILLEKLGYPPVVGRNMTLAMLKHRMEDYKRGSSKNLKIFLIKDIKTNFRFGAFEISFFKVEHSVIDAVGAIFKTPSGTVIHPGDWTLEKDAKGKPFLDYSFLANLPKPTVLMLEALGVVDVRPSATTVEMKRNIHELIKNAPGRMIIGTFSSQVERAAWILDISARLGKKVALDGYSMKMNVGIAQKLGYIKVKKGSLIKIDQVDNYPDNKVVVLCTGSQGEGNAVLSRVIEGGHKNIKLKKTDTVILSSSIIPGNEQTIQKLKDNLYRQSDNVIHGGIMDIHVSGHGNRDDVLHMIKTIKSDYFIPSYANHYMLKEAAKLAKEEAGYKEKNIFVADNGQIIEVGKNEARLTNRKVPSDYVFVDGLGVGDISNVVLRDRQTMAADGMLVVIATMEKKTGKLIGSPDIISRGFVYMKGNRKLIEETRDRVRKIVADKNPKTGADDSYVKDRLRNEIGRFLFQKTERRPMILPVVIWV